MNSSNEEFSFLGNMTAPLAGAVKKARLEINKVALIDADYLKYYVVKDVYDEIQKHGEVIGKYGVDYLHIFVNKRLDEIMESLNAKGYIFCFSGNRKKTFRYYLAVEKEYKGNRSSGSSYEYNGVYEDMAAVMSIIKERYPVVVYPDLEADDILASLQNEHTFIYSHDKDMKQVPGTHYDISFNKIVEVSKEDGFKSICSQMLEGDSADNITGIPGVGKKGRMEFMMEHQGKNLLSDIWHFYKSRYGIMEGTDRFVENWSLLRLRANRGAWYQEKISDAINTRDLIIVNNIKV